MAEHVVFILRFELPMGTRMKKVIAVTCFAVFSAVEGEFDTADVVVGALAGIVPWEPGVFVAQPSVVTWTGISAWATC